MRAFDKPEPYGSSWSVRCRKNLVSTEWLAQNLEAQNLVVVDASWYLPTLKRDGKAEYLKAHIPGGMPFDIEEISDHSNPLPHIDSVAGAIRPPDG